MDGMAFPRCFQHRKKAVAKRRFLPSQTSEPQGPGFPWISQETMVKNGRTSQAMWGSPNAINIYKPIRPIIWGKFIPPNSWRFRAWFILGFTTIWVSLRHDFSQSDFWTFLGMVKTCKDCKDLKKFWAGSCWIARINSVSQIHFYVKRHTIP